MTEKIIAAVLGGGVGSRLYPLTKDQSKPAVSVAAKYKLIDIPISNCLNAAIDRIFVLTQFNSASLNRHLKNTYQFNTFQKGFVDILAAEQTHDNTDWFQGTADAIRQSMHHLESHDYEHLLILSGDQLYQMDFRQMFQQHVHTNADITIATIPVDSSDAPKFGIMKVAESGSIKSFIEKPNYNKLHNWKSNVSPSHQREGKYYLASMGIYIFKRSKLKALLKEWTDAIDFGKEIIPIAISNGCNVFSYLYDGFWTDIGNVKSYFETNLQLAQARRRSSPLAARKLFQLFNGKQTIFSTNKNLPPTQLINCCLIDSIIAEGSYIEAKNISNAVIGSNNIIRQHTIIKKAIIQENEKPIRDIQREERGIGENCYLENVIIESNCTIGNHVQIIGNSNLEDQETQNYCIKDGIIILKAGAVIPSHTHIGMPKTPEKKFNVIHLSN